MKIQNSSVMIHHFFSTRTVNKIKTLEKQLYFSSVRVKISDFSIGNLDELLSTFNRPKKVLYTLYCHYVAFILPLCWEYLASICRWKKNWPLRYICCLYLVSVYYQPHLTGVQSPSKIIFLSCYKLNSCFICLIFYFGH